jgi:hypothetical protein
MSVPLQSPPTAESLQNRLNILKSILGAQVEKMAPEEARRQSACIAETYNHLSRHNDLRSTLLRQHSLWLELADTLEKIQRLNAQPLTA